MRALVGMIALSMMFGCVPKAKYEALEDRMQDCREELRKREAAAKKRMQAHQELLADLKPLIDKGLLEVEVVDGRTVIGMRAEVLFPSGSAELSNAGHATVTELARHLARRTDSEWQVEGHTDSEPIATEQFPNNWYLGAARAITVLEAMVEAGMSPRHVSAATFGQFAPVVGNNDDQGRARNRRIEIVLLPDLSDVPGYEQMMSSGGRHRQRDRGGDAGPGHRPGGPPGPRPH